MESIGGEKTIPSIGRSSFPSLKWPTLHICHSPGAGPCADFTPGRQFNFAGDLSTAGCGCEPGAFSEIIGHGWLA
jgi:hypothetical protein